MHTDLHCLTVVFSRHYRMSSFKDYRVIRQLPGGAQSKTYLVELKATRQQFIMKMVNYLEQVDKAKVDVEVELMRSLDSDFTVHLVCIFPDPMEIQLCMILEYCVRGDFRNLIDEFQQLPQSEKLMRGWEYTAQITRALDHLHSHNVMHRDLKPANILVNQDGSIRLGDFGLSREMNEDYYLTIAGTKVYMAPEVHLLKRMNKSSDMFSLGVIIFQLITGHHPYEADSEEAMIDKIKKNKVLELPDWVSNQMKETIKWMMNQNENHRPTTKIILSHDVILMYLRQIEGHKQLQIEKINALNERDLIIEERNQERVEKVRALADVDRERTEKEGALVERDRERIEKERYQSERDQEKNRANIAEQDKQKEIQEKQKAQSERDQEKRRADTEHAENDKLKLEKQKDLQEKQKFQSEVTRLITENQHIKAELSKLRPQITSPQEQSKLEPKLQQIQQTVPSSLNTINYQSIIPDREDVIQQKNKIIRTNKGLWSTVAFNPVITSGIVRFGGFFKDHSRNNFNIGISDSSAVFGSNEAPVDGGNLKKTVRYWKNGELGYIGDYIKGNSRIEENKTVAMEVNMNIRPRALTFFYDNQEQPVSVINIPSSIRFYIFLFDNNSSFTITEFSNVQYSSAKGGIKGQRIVEWGKEWKK
ncbi:MAG: putative serine/threonine-protein kinase Nek6 [Streblomastix strix]|uniref:non-specific serine/threonine protein kinase n=4 Tax=Streblomastix strix TaxID=222440 RepID=A0A5J4WM20_9EUKA|nr:MAG: putative serine/threonine-protein kinase Nek6 [Streblomastix strix]